MDFTPILAALGQYGPSYFILWCVLYWLFTVYIPSKDKEHSEQLASMQMLFKNSLDQIVASYNTNSAWINTRLDKIEEDIRKIK